jgi:hypothetical protein
MGRNVFWWFFPVRTVENDGLEWKLSATYALEGGKSHCPLLLQMCLVHKVGSDSSFRSEIFFLYLSYFADKKEPLSVVIPSTKDNSKLEKLN